MSLASADFWRDKRVLVTGHTGFKGAWLCIWLSRMGASVTGLGLPPNGEKNLFTAAKIDQLIDSNLVDIREFDELKAVVSEANPEIVLHLAAQSLVRSSYDDPLGTVSTNVIGTANLLNSLREIKAVKTVLVVTTDKVYKNVESHTPYRETDTLGGHDPYSASKAACELIVASMRDSFLKSCGIGVATARAGNVIGGGDWSRDRLIPDAIKAWSSDVPLFIRRPQSVRPWQHVLEPLNGYLVLVERLSRDKGLSGAYNFGPESADAASVRFVIELAREAFGSGSVNFETILKGPHEAEMLKLDIGKAREVLGFLPRWNLQESVKRSVYWYCQELSGAKSAFELCISDIKDFSEWSSS